VLLVESDPKAARTARENIALLGAADQVSLTTARVSQALAAGPAGAGYDVVFADPPYAVAEREIAEMLAGLVERGWLAPDATVVVERSRRSPEPAWVPCITGQRSRRYGDTTLWYGRGS
jgi:16S rRNA G966 N2-methylase RsmD